MFGNVYGQDSATIIIRIWLLCEDELEYDREVCGELWMLSMLTMYCQMHGTVLGIRLWIR